MGEYLGKKQCPKCAANGGDTSENNLIMYSDGGYCHACEYVDKNLDEEEMPTEITKPHNMIPTKICAIPLRGLSLDTCKKFNYGIGRFTGEAEGQLYRDAIVHVADRHGKGQHIRTKDKKFKQLGDCKGLGLQYLDFWSANPNTFLTITEGDIDCLSMYEAFGDQYPVVTVPSGAGSAYRSIAKDIERLHKWKHVVLCLDQDTAGQEATIKCTELFEPGQLKVAKLPLNDVNDMLLAGKTKELKDALWRAEEIMPEGIVTVSDVLEELLEAKPQGIDWAFKPMTDITYGMKKGELVVIAAAASIGKTEVCKDLVFDLVINKEQRAAIFSFEESSKSIFPRLAGRIVKKPLHIPSDIVHNKEELTKAFMTFDGKIFTNHKPGGYTIETLVSKLRFLVKAQGVSIVVIDNLTQLAAKMTGNERVGIDKTMDALKEAAGQLDVCVVLVSHVSRDKTEGEESWANGRKPKLENLRGSASIENYADTVFGLSRNKMATDSIDQTIMTVECLKNRPDARHEGRSFALKFDDSMFSYRDMSTIL